MYELSKAPINILNISYRSSHRAALQVIHKISGWETRLQDNFFFGRGRGRTLTSLVKGEKKKKGFFFSLAGLRAGAAKARGGRQPVLAACSGHPARPGPAPPPSRPARPGGDIRRQRRAAGQQLRSRAGPSRAQPSRAHRTPPHPQRSPPRSRRWVRGIRREDAGRCAGMHGRDARGDAGGCRAQCGGVLGAGACLDPAARLRLPRVCSAGQPPPPAARTAGR